MEWAGFCFAVYNFVAFGFSFLLVRLVRTHSPKSLHRMCLTCAGLGLASVGWWHHPWGLLVSMVGVGVGWASILSMPYALLSNGVPPERMGFYMGVFNFFIVLPQILAATVLGLVVKPLFGGSGLPVVILGGISLLLAAAAMSFVRSESAVGSKAVPEASF